MEVVVNEVIEEAVGGGAVPDLYAPPLVFGPWAVVTSHVGSVRYRITFEPLGDTTVFGQVRYFKYANLPKVEEDIVSGDEITTADVAANVELHFKGKSWASSSLSGYFP